MHNGIHDKACGRWTSILPQLGVGVHFLNGRHGPCPVCGGKDRFRFDDKEGKGTFYCSGCGAGTGVDLVMRVLKCDFRGAVKQIEELLPSTTVVLPKAAKEKPTDARAIWHRGLPVVPGDLVARYLASRGIAPESFPTQIRLMERAVYRHDDGRTETFPAMLANFVSPCTRLSIAYFTFLDRNDGKAAVPKQKRFTFGAVPPGGAIRLAPSAETMGIAEGIETALSASALFEIPVWAAANTGALVKWQPPETAKNIIIFGDHDEKFGGQHAAYALAYRLRCQLKLNVEVRFPDDVGTDWNDVLLAERSMEAA